MATNTSKFKLRKPAVTDPVDVVQDISDNMDKIDNLALMNRPSSTEEQAIRWATTMYGNHKYLEINAPIDFKQQIYLATFHANGTAEIGQWRAVCKCWINPTASTSIVATFIYTAGNPLLSGATKGGGMFCVFQRTPTAGPAQSQLELRWLCGSNINVNDYAVGVKTEEVDGETMSYIYLYCRKESIYHTSMFTCLEFHRNYTLDQYSFVDPWIDVSDEPGIDSDQLPSVIAYSQAPANFITN